MAQLLSSNITGNLIVTQNTTVSGNLIVGSTNILPTLSSAANTVKLTQNSGSTQSAVSLNFVNTSTVTVSVTSGETGVANVAFTSTASGSGTVTSVGTGTGLTGGPITSTGTISANIANTTVQGVTKLIDVVTSTDSGNAATANSVKLAFDQGTNAYGQANLAYTQANTARNQANTAYDQANTAFTTANSSANTVQVSANSAGPTLSKVSLNFVNTATIRTSVVSSGGGTVANIGFDYIGASTTTFPVSGNTAGPTVSASGINFNNTATIRVNVGSGITGNANVSFDYIGSVTGGSGINNFPVSANSLSTQTANGLNFLNSAFITATVSSGTTGNANVTLSLTQNVTLTTLNVTNIQDGSSNVFVRNSRFVVDTSWVSQSTSLVNPYGPVHIGIAQPGYLYSNIGGYSFVQNANSKIYGLDILNANSGSAAKASIYLATGPDGVTDYLEIIASTGLSELFTTERFNITSDKDLYIISNKVADVTGNVILQDQSSGDIATFRGNGVSVIHKNLFVGSTNVAPAIASAANTVRVTSNSLFAQSAVSLNFINTASIIASVGPGATGNANVSFSAVAGSTTVAGILQLTDSVTSTSTTTAATPNSVKTAFDQGTTAYGQANAAFAQANTARDQANSAYTTANSAANTVQVTANSGTALSKVSLNFVNTATIRTSVISSGGGTTANILFDYIGSGTTTFPVSGNSSGPTVSATGINFNNTSTIRVNVESGTTGNANVEFVQIISAGSVTNTATITPVRTGPHSHYAVTALNTAATINPPAINSGVDGDRLTLRILDSGTGRALTWNTSAGAYRAVGVTLPTTTVAGKVIYIGSIYNSQNNFWDVVAYVQQA